MRFLEKLALIERIDALIRRKGTGTANELAEKIAVSRRCVYDIIDVMKQMGAPVEYCANRKSFYYTKECELAIGFVDPGQTRGGHNYFWQNNSCADFLHNPALCLHHDASRDILRTL